MNHSDDGGAVGLGACLTLLIASITVAATPQGARNAITKADLKEHVAFLASDTLEGRKAGSQGGRAAAAYLAQQFREAGLQPGTDDGDFLQPFGNGYQNLLAVRPGTDPDVSHQVILISGHFDHVGFGDRTNSFGPYGQIHNGADDNASGTAAVLEVAEAIASLDDPPRRTVLFALWDAEESGMVGSKHWLKEPTVDLDNVRLMVNLDMVGRLRDALTIYGVRTAAGLRQRLGEANGTSALTLNFDWRQRKDSDHWPFFEQGIPYLMLHTGEHGDYHRPSDDVDKLNFDGLQSLSRLLFELTRSVANAESLPSFRNASRQERQRDQRQADVVSKPPEPRLGLSWHNDREPMEPFVVKAVDLGSPAALAGFRPADRITQFAGRAAADAQELVDLVLAAPSETMAVIERDGHDGPLTLAVTLRGNPVRIGVGWREDDAEPGVAIVTTVVPGSPAAACGVKPLDRLLPPPGERTTDVDWLLNLAGRDAITLRRERSGRMTEIVLKPLPPARRSD